MTNPIYDTTNPTESDAKQQGTRDASIRKTIETVARIAECPHCHQHPLDCACYGMFGKRTQAALPVVKTWQPWKLKEPIYP